MNHLTLDTSQKSRYQGHISLCEIDIPGQAAICRGKVLIVGAGGLGDPAAIYLAAAGVGHIGIVDPDKVTISNLQRQILHCTADIGRPKVDSVIEKLTGINPDVRITPYRIRLTPGNAEKIIADYDIVVDCTDNFDTRMLINDTCVNLKKPFIFGSVYRFRGQMFTHIPGSADLRTIFGWEPPALTEPCAVSGILNSVVGVIGSLQATEAIKYLANAGDLLINKLLTFDAITMNFSTYTISPE